MIDVVVAGGGAMGLATAWWLAPQARVVVLDRFEFGHRRGASHGDERIFRYLYPDAAYVEMALAAEDGWFRLERDAGSKLLHRVGSVQHGDLSELDALEHVADRFGVATERLTVAEATERWPGMRFSGEALLQPDAGWVHAAGALEDLARLASDAGAELRFDCPVRSVVPEAEGVRVTTADETYLADVIVVTAGAWSTALLEGVPLPPLLTTEEHVFFFRAEDAGHAHDVPTFIHDSDCLRYGLPGPKGLVKIGEHHTGTVTTGDERTFAEDPERQARMERYVAEWMPGLVPEAVDTTTCLYTSTPTHDFVLERVGPIVIGAGFSGHGFKFVPEVGRRLAKLATDDSASYPRFGLAEHERRSA